MNRKPSADLRNRLDERVAAWRVDMERVAETGTSLLAFGQRDGQPIVLKIINAAGEEWRSGKTLAAFGGRGVVRVYEWTEGAILLERLMPGESLESLAFDGADHEATRLFAGVIQAMPADAAVEGMPTAADWGRAFETYSGGADQQIPRPLLSAAQEVYADLCRTQRNVRLLHGDLHHENVLFDSQRGWLAIDPKGVVAELEYEAGAFLRNPYGRPALFADPVTIQRRVDRLSADLKLDSARVLSWAFSQAVLAAVWAVEDGLPVEQDHGWIALANSIRPMLRRRHET